MKKIGFNGYVYDFSVGYDDIEINNIKHIHKSLMKKNNNYKMFLTRLMVLSSLTNATR